MKILHKYLIRTALNNIFVSSLLFFTLFYFITFLAEADDIGKGQYTIIEALWHSLLLLVAYFYHIFPFACLIGILFAFSSLQKNRELIIIRMQGYSRQNLAIITLSVVFGLLLVVNLTGELIGPKLEQNIELRKKILEHNGQMLKTAQGVWLHLNDSFIYISEFDSKHNTLRDLYRYKLNEDHSELVETAYVASAVYVDHKWQLHDVVNNVFEEDKVVTQHHQESQWQDLFPPDFISAMQTKAHKVTLHDLMTLNKYKKRAQLNLQENYQFQLWQRIFNPFTALMMIFLALPFSFQSKRNTSQVTQVFIGGMIGCGVIVVNIFLDALVNVYAISPIISALVPGTLSLALGIYFFRRIM